MRASTAPRHCLKVHGSCRRPFRSRRRRDRVRSSLACGRDCAPRPVRRPAISRAEADRMDRRIDDLVAVARDDHSRRLDIAVARRGSEHIAIKPATSMALARKACGPQHQRDREPRRHSSPAPCWEQRRRWWRHPSAAFPPDRPAFRKTAGRRPEPSSICSTRRSRRPARDGWRATGTPGRASCRDARGRRRRSPSRRRNGRR